MKIKLLSQKAKAPTRATAGSAGLDLYAIDDVIVPAGKTALLKTDVAIEIPVGIAALVCSRSGLALKGVWVANAPGIVDSDFRDGIGVILYNSMPIPYHVSAGDRIAQILLQKYEMPMLDIVDSLSDTDRGTGGFGSSGQ